MDIFNTCCGKLIVKGLCTLIGGDGGDGDDEVVLDMSGISLKDTVFGGNTSLVDSSGGSDPEQQVASIPLDFC